jgi:hypothetical protein
MGTPESPFLKNATLLLLLSTPTSQMAQACSVPGICPHVSTNLLLD